ncbi:MAG: glutathione S-transferase family protein [Alphaproteobacteria bacterium]|nr:MAG: glutathione S-transferase family protein [Alphaproteobacteria bacterium]
MLGVTLIALALTGNGGRAVFHLIIGTKRYSTWSLRPWFLMKAFDIPFEETIIKLRQDETVREIRKLSPSGLVPVLRADEMTVTDSLAIAEYLADRFPEKQMWPEDRLARAHGRMICAEMHSGFQALRQEMPMDFGSNFDPVKPSPQVQSNIDRIVAIWSDALSMYRAEGPWLLGQLSIADAMYAPVVSRFRSYGIRLPAPAQNYAEQVWHHPAMKEWGQGAALEG